MLAILKRFSVSPFLKDSSLLEKLLVRKYIDPQALAAFSLNLREKKETLVTLNGSFDLLHPGHLDMLYQASMQGDVLLILLNSDASIKTYKNPKRPFNSLEVRLVLMAALEMVDFVSWFDETDPCSVLNTLRPNVHVNGAEYGEDCIEAQTVKKHGGRLHIVPLVSGFSSTNLIAKIRDEACD